MIFVCHTVFLSVEKRYLKCHIILISLTLIYFESFFLFFCQRCRWRRLKKQNNCIYNHIKWRIWHFTQISQWYLWHITCVNQTFFFFFYLLRCRFLIAQVSSNPIIELKRDTNKSTAVIQQEMNVDHFDEKYWISCWEHYVEDLFEISSRTLWKVRFPFRVVSGESSETLLYLFCSRGETVWGIKVKAAIIVHCSVHVTR